MYSEAFEKKLKQSNEFKLSKNYPTYVNKYLGVKKYSELEGELIAYFSKFYTELLIRPEIEPVIIVKRQNMSLNFFDIHFDLKFSTIPVLLHVTNDEECCYTATLKCSTNDFLLKDYKFELVRNADTLQWMYVNKNGQRFRLKDYSTFEIAIIYDFFRVYELYLDKFEKTPFETK